MRSLLLFALIGLQANPTAAQDTAESPAGTLARPEIRLAVRTETKPFIWKDAKSGGYRGIFWDICSTAVERAGYKFETVEISAKQRADLFLTGRFAPPDEYERADPVDPKSLTERADLVCDPTTITLVRMRWFSRESPGSAEETLPKPASMRSEMPDFAKHFEFSPILFVANGSFVRRSGGLRPPPDEQITWLDWICPPDSTPSGTRWERWLRRHCVTSSAPSEEPNVTSSVGYIPRDWQGDFCERKLNVLDQGGSPPRTPTGTQSGRYLPPIIRTEKVRQSRGSYEVWGFVTGSTIGQSIVDTKRRVAADIKICTRSLPTHEVAAREFCEGRLYRYFGDVELVKAAIGDYEAATAKSCNADMSGTATGSYEPYALIASAERFPELPERLSLALYGMFTDRTIFAFFDGQFGEDRRSKYLDILYKINGIPVGLSPNPLMRESVTNAR